MGTCWPGHRVPGRWLQAQASPCGGDPRRSRGAACGLGRPGLPPSSPLPTPASFRAGPGHHPPEGLGALMVERTLRQGGCPGPQPPWPRGSQHSWGGRPPVLLLAEPCPAVQASVQRGSAGATPAGVEFPRENLLRFQQGHSQKPGLGHPRTHPHAVAGRPEGRGRDTSGALSPASRSPASPCGMHPSAGLEIEPLRAVGR